MVTQHGLLNYMHKMVPYLFIVARATQISRVNRLYSQWYTSCNCTRKACLNVDKYVIKT